MMGLLIYKYQVTVKAYGRCGRFGWNWPSGSWDEDFKISSMYFCYFVIISPWKRAGPFIRTNLSPLDPLFCAKFGWNWPSGSWEDENVKSLRHQQRQRTNFSREPSAQMSLNRAGSLSGLYSLISDYRPVFAISL